MNQLQVFHSLEFGEFLILEENGIFLFPATRCAQILGYINARKAILSLCTGGVLKRDVPHPQSPTKTIRINFISEGDLYRLIIRSRLLSSKRFESWIFDEVLPTIRKKGFYSVKPTLDSDVQKLNDILAQIHKLQDQINDINNFATALELQVSQFLREINGTAIQIKL